MPPSLRDSIAGNVQVAHLVVCALVATVGMAGLGHLGASMGGAIGGDADGAAAAQSLLSPAPMAMSAQAGVEGNVSGVTKSSVLRALAETAERTALTARTTQESSQAGRGLRAAGLSIAETNRLVNRAVSVDAINPAHGGPCTTGARMRNCAQVSASVDHTLNGHAASALPQFDEAIQPLVDARQNGWTVTLDSSGRYFAGLGVENRPVAYSGGEVGRLQVVDAVRRWGHGAKGLVTVNWAENGGHVHNVMNVGGKVVFLDVQETHAVGELANRLEHAVWGHLHRTQDLSQEMHAALLRRIQRPSGQYVAFDADPTALARYIDGIVTEAAPRGVFPATLQVDARAALLEKIQAYPVNAAFILRQAAAGKRTFSAKELANMTLLARSTLLPSGERVIDLTKISGEGLPLDEAGIRTLAHEANAQLVGGGMARIIFDPTVRFTKAITRKDAEYAVAFHGGGELVVDAEGPAVALYESAVQHVDTATSADLAVEP